MQWTHNKQHSQPVNDATKLLTCAQSKANDTEAWFSSHPARKQILRQQVQNVHDATRQREYDKTQY